MSVSIHEPNGKETSGVSIKALTLEVRPDGVAVITYDVPGEAVNTLKQSFAQEFDEVFGKVASDSKITGGDLESRARRTPSSPAPTSRCSGERQDGRRGREARGGPATMAVEKIVDCRSRSSPPSTALRSAAASRSPSPATAGS